MKSLVIFLACLMVAEPFSDYGDYTTTADMPSPGQWSSWSGWSRCTGDCTHAVQSRTRHCQTANLDGYLACVGESREQRRCTPTVRVEDCGRCKFNAANVGYLMNCADATKYYQCEKTGHNSYTLHVMSCPPCTKWNQDKLSCLRIPDQKSCHADANGSSDEDVDVFGETCRKGRSRFGLVKGDDTKYLVYDNGVAIMMPCPAGTVFNLTQCTCVYDELASHRHDLTKCINFETMTGASSWGFSEGGMWIGNNGKTWSSPHVQVTSNSCQEGHKCAFFGGHSYLSIASLANAFHTWKTFMISFWYKPTSSDGMGLLTNGFVANGCSSLPTIHMSTQGDEVSGAVFTTSSAVVHVKGKITPGVWNHVVIGRDNKYVFLIVNGKLADKEKLEGDLRHSHCPVILGTSQNGVFYKGYLDNVCFHKGSTAMVTVNFKHFLYG